MVYLAKIRARCVICSSCILFTRSSLGTTTVLSVENIYSVSATNSSLANSNLELEITEELPKEDSLLKNYTRESVTSAIAIYDCACLLSIVYKLL